MSARIASPFFIGVFGLVFLLAQVAAGEAQQLRSSWAAAVKNNQPEDDAARGPADGPDCESSLSVNPRARLFVTSERPRSDATRCRKGNWDRANKGGAALSDDPTPTFQADTVFCTQKAAERYRRIADLGGWASISQPIGRNAPHKMSRGCVSAFRRKVTCARTRLLERVGMTHLGNTPK